MGLPTVAIVGRPNVGKSSLLNALARERVSIVDPRAGITRDRVSVILNEGDRWLELVDTGGVGIVDDDHLEEHVEAQIRFALDKADLVVFVVDVHDGITPLDLRVAEELRRLGKRVVLAVNKVDQTHQEPQAAEFHRLGFGEPVCVSAQLGFGRTALLERVLASVTDLPGEIPPDPVMRLAIVGKRNAGKSTLVNALARDERMIVSETPGTTRDAVDVRFERDGRVFVAIDTAGVRKKRSMNDVDFYSYTRAIRSIERADVVIHLIDATVALSEVDLRLVRSVLDAHKPLLLVVNKWDLVGDRATSTDFSTYLTRVLPMAPFAPIVFITAKSGRNVGAAADVAQSLFNQAQTRVTTGQLNSAIEDLMQARAPSGVRGAKPLRLYYATQVSTAPPTLVFFCNSPALVTDNFRRYLENRLRERLPFAEVPIRMLFRSRRAEPAAAGPRPGAGGGG